MTYLCPRCPADISQSIIPQGRMYELDGVNYCFIHAQCHFCGVTVNRNYRDRLFPSHNSKWLALCHLHNGCRIAGCNVFPMGLAMDGQPVCVEHACTVVATPVGLTCFDLFRKTRRPSPISIDGVVCKCELHHSAVSCRASYKKGSCIAVVHAEGLCFTHHKIAVNNARRNTQQWFEGQAASNRFEQLPTEIYERVFFWLPHPVDIMSLARCSRKMFDVFSGFNDRSLRLSAATIGHVEFRRAVFDPRGAEQHLLYSEQMGFYYKQTATKKSTRSR